MKKRIFVFVLILAAVIVSSFALTASAEDRSVTEGYLTYNVSAAGATISYCSRGMGNIYIPDSVAGVPVIGVDEYAFSWCTNVSNITVSEKNAYLTVKDGVLYTRDMTNLILFPQKSQISVLNIPASVNHIYWYAFEDCRNLTEINVDENNAFYKSCDGVLFDKDMSTLLRFPGGKKGEYKMPAGVKRLRNDAFYGSSAERIEIADTVETIGRMAFAKCDAIKEIAIPDSVKIIEYGAFMMCDLLERVRIGKGLETIEDQVFYDCERLFDFTVDPGNEIFKSPDGVLIKADTFVQYPMAKANRSYNVPEGVKYIEDNAFTFCKTLQSVTIPKGVVKVGRNAFQNCDSLMYVNILGSDEGTVVENNVFFECRALTTVFFGNGVREIEGNAFCGCRNLKTITLPKSLNKVEPSAFWDCWKVETVFYGGSRQEWLDIGGYSTFGDRVMRYNSFIPA